MSFLIKKEFYKEHPDDKVWWVDEYLNGELLQGRVSFSFDKKKVLDYWTDYEKLSKDEKWIFDEENPFWALFNVADEEKAQLIKEHPKWTEEDIGEADDDADMSWLDSM